MLFKIREGVDGHSSVSQIRNYSDLSIQMPNRYPIAMPKQTHQKYCPLAAVQPGLLPLHFYARNLKGRHIGRRKYGVFSYPARIRIAEGNDSYDIVRFAKVGACPLSCLDLEYPRSTDLCPNFPLASWIAQSPRGGCRCSLFLAQRGCWSTCLVATLYEVINRPLSRNLSSRGHDSNIVHTSSSLFETCTLISNFFPVV
jgi:hypothetical protein